MQTPRVSCSIKFVRAACSSESSGKRACMEGRVSSVCVQASTKAHRTCKLLAKVASRAARFLQPGDDKLLRLVEVLPRNTF